MDPAPSAQRVSTETSLEQFVIQAVATCTNCSSSEISRDTVLADIMVDSLGISAVVTQVEVAYGCRLSDLQLAQVIQSRDIAEIVATLTSVIHGAKGQSQLTSSVAQTRVGGGSTPGSPHPRSPESV